MALITSLCGEAAGSCFVKVANCLFLSWLDVQAVAFGQGVVALLPQLQALSEILPPPTLAWKLQLLEEGNRCAIHSLRVSYCWIQVF